MSPTRASTISLYKLKVLRPIVGTVETHFGGVETHFGGVETHFVQALIVLGKIPAVYTTSL